jgi:FixJ family two-component response regulator
MNSISAATFTAPSLVRDRVIYVAHKDADLAEGLSRSFARSGFKSSTAGNVDALGSLVTLRRPDVILLDTNLTTSHFEVVDTLRELTRGSRICLLAEVNPQAAELARAVRSGALTVFIRPFDADEIVRTLIDEFALDVRHWQHPHDGADTLTPREREVVEAVVMGLTTREAAERFGISPRTVEVHRHSAMRKLHARNTAELVRKYVDVK